MYFLICFSSPNGEYHALEQPNHLPGKRRSPAKPESQSHAFLCPPHAMIRTTRVSRPVLIVIFIAVNANTVYDRVRSLTLTTRHAALLPVIHPLSSRNLPKRLLPVPNLSFPFHPSKSIASRTLQHSSGALQCSIAATTTSP